jgi:hypothetical protein
MRHYFGSAPPFPLLVRFLTLIPLKNLSFFFLNCLLIQSNTLFKCTLMLFARHSFILPFDVNAQFYFALLIFHLFLPKALIQPTTLGGHDRCRPRITYFQI